MKTRRSVLGDAHVDRASANVTEIDAGFQRYITENVWNGVWTSDAGLGHEEELAMHIRATLNTGATREDIREVLMHVAVYAGVPTANTAFRIAKQTYAEIDAAAKGE
jgi:4-carboxymuconolactone decarboxylase